MDAFTASPLSALNDKVTRCQGCKMTGALCPTHAREWQQACVVDARPTIGSLCTGYGGLDSAAEAFFGARTIWCAEFDKHASVIVEQRFPGCPNHGDITKIDWSAVEPVDILTAGYPCQPFSHAGKRKGENDPRHIWPHIAKGIGALRPRVVLLENVLGHVRLGLDSVVKDLAAMGYDATWGVVRASDAGAPHRRARVYIVATDASRELLNRGGNVGPGGGGGQLADRRC